MFLHKNAVRFRFKMKKLIKEGKKIGKKIDKYIAEKWFPNHKGWDKFRSESLDVKLFVVVGWIFLIGVFTFGVILFLNIAIKEFFELLKRNFGVWETGSILEIFVSAIGVTFLLIFLVWTLYRFRYDTSKPFKGWFIITLGIMGLIFFFGIFSIDFMIGNKIIQLNLLDEDLIKKGTIKCGDENQALFAGLQIDCEIKTYEEFDNLSLSLSFYYSDNRTPKTILIREGSFIAPSNVRYIAFNVVGYKGQETQNLSVGHITHFLSASEFKENQERFLTFVLALLAIVFVTVPSAMVNLKNLWEDKKGK